MVVCGEVHGHPEFEDGSKIETSRVHDFLGRDVSTASGSNYRLIGMPEQGFMDWLKREGLTLEAVLKTVIIGEK